MVGDATLQAGMKAMTVHGEKPMPVALFYPTRAQARVMPVGPFAPFVAFNGAPEMPFKGLILLSHGTGGSQLAHHNLARRLAQNGYLVAAPQHPGDNWEDRSLALSAAYFAERPRQLSRLLDAVLADSQWHGQIPAGRIGALGFSAGGYSVLALAGGIADRQRAIRHCAVTDDDQLFCRLGGDLSNAADAATTIDFDVLDPRVRAVFAMAPIGAVFAPESLARIKLPLQLVTAARDEVLTPKYHGDWLRARLPQAAFEQVQNAGHFAFMAQPTMPLMSEAGDPGDNPPGFDRPAYLLRLERQVVEFFDKHFGEIAA